MTKDEKDVAVAAAISALFRSLEPAAAGPLARRLATKYGPPVAKPKKAPAAKKGK